MPLKDLKIRLAKATDAMAHLEIYRPHVTESAASFELELPSVTEFRSRIVETMKETPWLTAEINGVIVGYAYASKHRSRMAYQWCLESSVYVHGDYRGIGIGAVLYKELFRMLKALGYYNVYGGITLPNKSSVALHESLGFKLVGVYEKVGFKFGRWYDVGWWHLRLNESKKQPQAPKKLSELEITFLDNPSILDGERN